jgi:hypothetical protein
VKEAVNILARMGHNMNVWVARFLAYTVHKIITRIYSSIVVSDADLDKVRAAI